MVELKQIAELALGIRETRSPSEWLDLAFYFTVLDIFDYKAAMKTTSGSSDSLKDTCGAFRPDFKVFIVNQHLKSLNCPEQIMVCEKETMMPG